jgi:hypothetical protein
MLEIVKVAEFCSFATLLTHVESPVFAANFLPLKVTFVHEFSDRSMHNGFHTIECLIKTSSSPFVKFFGFYKSLGQQALVTVLIIISGMTTLVLGQLICMIYLGRGHT